MPLTMLSDWWSGLETKAKAVTAIVATIAAVGAGSWAIDARYAKAEDMKAQVGGIKQLYLQSERRSIRKELFDLEVTEKKRPLTELERRRKRDLEDEQREIDDQLKTLKK